MKLRYLLPFLLCASLWGQGATVLPKTTSLPKTTVFPGTALASPTVVQTQTCIVSTTTCSATFSTAVVAGHYLFCYADGTGNSSGVSCTMTGETITRRTGAAGCSNNAGFEGDCYIGTNAVGGQTVITCTMSTGSGGTCMFAEITSPQGGHAIDTGGNAHSATTAFSVSTNAATTNASDICLGMGGNNSASGSYSALSWTSVINTATTSGTMLLMSTVPGSTGTQTATATAQTGVTNQPEGVICLKP